MSPSAIESLSNLASQAAAATPDVPAELAAAIRGAADSPADPWLLIGVLIEGAAHTIRTAIPEERRAPCVVAAMRLLADRTATGRTD
jgi:hypothetical protein